MVPHVCELDICGSPYSAIIVVFQIVIIVMTFTRFLSLHYCIVDFLITIDVEHFLIFNTEVLPQSICEYGIKDIILKLKERNIISLGNYNGLSQLNISDYHKCIILAYYIIENIIRRRRNYEQFRLLMSSDRRLWNLKVAMSQLCKHSILFLWI